MHCHHPAAEDTIEGAHCATCWSWVVRQTLVCSPQTQMKLVASYVLCTAVIIVILVIIVMCVSS
jgi:hypothetical protein